MKKTTKKLTAKEKYIKNAVAEGVSQSWASKAFKLKQMLNKNK